jgi:deoxyribonuclease (pyrimidine dimer)
MFFSFVMVRVNLIDPGALADQHLVAEYREILMLLGHARKHPPQPGTLPSTYRLGKGHILFFKDKLRYLSQRHGLLCVEMRRRGMHPLLVADLSSFPGWMLQGWSPRPEDVKIIKSRLVQKLRMKEGFYRYEGRPQTTAHLVRLVERAKAV